MLSAVHKDLSMGGCI